MENNDLLAGKMEDFLKGTELCIKLGPDTFVKIPIAHNIYIIYSQYNLNEKYLLRIYENIEFEGIWNNETATLYESGYRLNQILKNNVNCMSKKELEQIIDGNITNIILDYVKDNYNLLKNSIDPKSNYYSKWNDREGEAIQKAFIYDSPTFLSDFIPQWHVELNSDDFIDCIRGYCYEERVCQDLITEYQNKYNGILGLCILEYERVNIKIKEIKDDLNNPLHKIKEIISIMKNNDYKTVNVTICKDEKRFTFKTDTQPLRIYSDYIGSYRIQAKDRKKFEEMFGRYEDYSFEDIIKITYGKQVLYQDKNKDIKEGLSA